jgi:release factor glutamine methyltransferase
MRTLWQEGVRRLTEAGIADADVEVELLIGHVIGLGRGAVQARLVTECYVPAADAAASAALLERRAAREPLQYITGSAAFRSLELAVGPGVFIPRPETEQVAQLAIDALRADAGAEPIGVDLGSGSGAIALAMATEVAHARIFAVESSAAAYRWTRRNVDALGGGAVRLVFGDLAEALPELDGRASVVISNPPYVPAGAIPHDPEVRGHDPAVALYAGADGLEVVCSVSAAGWRMLRPGGMLVIEHAEFQSDDVRRLLETDGWRAVAHHRDLSGRDRATTALR